MRDATLSTTRSAAAAYPLPNLFQPTTVGVPRPTTLTNRSARAVRKPRSSATLWEQLLEYFEVRLRTEKYAVTYFFWRERSKAQRPTEKGRRRKSAVRGRGYKWKVPCRACERQGRRPVYAADGTLALGGRPWVRNHIRQRRSRYLLAEWI